MIKVHKQMLNTKYQSSMSSSFRKKNFEVGFLCSYVPTCDHKGGASFDPQDMICTYWYFIEVHTEMLTTKYQSSTPSSLRQEFEVGLLRSYVLTFDRQGGASFDARGII